MLAKSHAIYLLIITLMTLGCAYNVSPAISEDAFQSQYTKKRIPIKAGVYLDDDLKQYIYRQQNMDRTLEMRVGEYMSAIAMTIGSTLFGEAVPVNSLPPYGRQDKPDDVQVIIQPEILYFSGHAVGDLSGHLKTKTKLRITVYDLGGNIVWQDEAIAETRSENMDFVTNFLSGTKQAGDAGYQAISAAANTIIDNFHAKPVQEFFDLLVLEKSENFKNQGNLSGLMLFEQLYEKGQAQYNQKKFYSSLYLFGKALNLYPDDPAALFYTAANYTRIGEKDKALRSFADVIKKKASGKEASDAKKWIERLNDPLKIGVINGNNSNKYDSDNRVIQDSLTSTGMYQIINTGKPAPSKKSASTSGFSQLLNKGAQKGIKVIILHDIDSFSRKAQLNTSAGEDVATEHILKLSAKIYSTKKKHLKTEIQVVEKSSTMQEQTEEQKTEIRQRQLQRGADKLVLQLLKNDIF